MKLRVNVGNLDLIIRVGLGLTLVTLMALGEIGAWGVIGLVLIVTGVARWCPIYGLLGISTGRKADHARPAAKAGVAGSRSTR